MIPAVTCVCVFCLSLCTDFFSFLFSYKILFFHLSFGLIQSENFFYLFIFATSTEIDDSSTLWHHCTMQTNNKKKKNKTNEIEKKRTITIRNKMFELMVFREKAKSNKKFWKKVRWREVLVCLCIFFRRFFDAFFPSDAFLFGFVSCFLYL